VRDEAVRPHFALKYTCLLEMAGGGINLGIDLMIFAPIVHSLSHWLCNDLWHLVGFGNRPDDRLVYASIQVELPICYLLQGQQCLPRAKSLFLLVSPLGLEPRTT
jgi:hypothetical protein